MTDERRRLEAAIGRDLPGFTVVWDDGDEAEPGTGRSERRAERHAARAERKAARDGRQAARRARRPTGADDATFDIAAEVDAEAQSDVAAEGEAEGAPQPGPDGAAGLRRAADGPAEQALAIAISPSLAALRTRYGEAKRAPTPAEAIAAGDAAAVVRLVEVLPSGAAADAEPVTVVVSHEDGESKVVGVFG